MLIEDEEVVEVHALKCGCGHIVTAIHQESAQAAMLEHLMFAHRGEKAAA